MPGAGAADTHYYLHGIDSTGPNDVWAVGEFAQPRPFPEATIQGVFAEHWTGASWSLVPISNSVGIDRLADVAAVSSTNVWAVGYANGSQAGRILHWNGADWRAAYSSTTALRSLTVVAPNDIWAAGSYLTVHWNGTQWSEIANPVQHDAAYLEDIDAVNANDVWAVAAYSPQSTAETYIIHWNGTQWSKVTSPNPAQNIFLRSVAAISATNVWAVGYSNPGGSSTGVTLHWNGSSWTPVAVESAGGYTELYDSDAVAANELWAVGLRQEGQGTGAHAVIERYQGGSACPTETPFTLAFSDVHSTDYFYEPVRYLVGHGVISGYGDNTFRPFNNATRGQMVKIVVLAFNKPIRTPNAPNYTFADVPRANPFFSFIESAAAADIVGGYFCGTAPEPCDDDNRPYFRPNANVTRGQLSKIVVAAAAWQLAQPATPTFADVSSNNPFFQQIETAVQHGIVSGYSCGGPGEACGTPPKPYFRWGNNATRGQIAKIIYNAVVTPTAQAKARP